MHKNHISEQSSVYTVNIGAALDECLEVSPEQSLLPSLFILEFEQCRDAEHCFQYVQKILPFTGLEYPQLELNTVLLTHEQFYCLQIQLMHEKGELQWEFLTDQYLMKTLRADQYDFTSSFKRGLIPGKEGRRFNNLRPTERGTYVITSEGEVVARVDKKPQYSPEQKKEYSQIQSNTFLDEKLLAEAFGFSKERNRKLYGLLTHLNDALISRLLIKDSGTVNRPFDFNDVQNAEHSAMFEKEAGKSHFYPPSKFKEFKQHNLLVRSSDQGTNEVLARIRFNPYRSLIVICSDTFETRLLADYFARELMQEFRVYAEGLGLTINPEFRIPIVYYLPAVSYLPCNILSYRPRLRFYTEKMRLTDKKECLRLYNNPSLRAQKFRDHDYEFILGLPEITSKILLDEATPSGKPLVLEMIFNCRTRVMSRMLRPVDNPSDNSLVDAVFDDLLRRNKIKKDDPIIANLISVEELDLAKKLIDHTKTDALKLSFTCDCSSKCHFMPMDRHLKYYGNPRQIALLGLKSIVDDFELLYSWSIKKLCLKEYPSECKELSGKLLYKASTHKTYKKHAEIKFLLEQGADTTFAIEGFTPIMCAADNQDWVVLSMFAEYTTDADDKANYGYALLVALKHQQKQLADSLMKAGARAHWRNSRPGFELVSTLYYAVMHEYSDLLPELIKHELSCAEGYIFRLYYARYFAISQNNNMAVTILSDNLGSMLTVYAHPSEDALRACLLNAAALGGVTLFVIRLREYLTTFITSKEENRRVLSNVKHWLDTKAITFSKTDTVSKMDDEILVSIVGSEDFMLYKLLEQLFVNVSDEQLVAMLSKLVSIAKEDNFHHIKMILEIIFQRYGKDVCMKKLDEAFVANIGSCDYAKAVFLVKIGAALNLDGRDLWRFESDLFKNIAEHEDQEAVFAILDNPRNSNRVKDHLFSSVILNSKTYNIREMMSLYPVEIDWFIFELALFSKNKEPLSHFIEVIFKDSGYKIKYSNPLMQLWAFRKHCPLDLLENFIQRCGASYVRHLSIMCMLDYMESATSNSWRDLEKQFPHIFKRNIRISTWDSHALENRPGSISPHYGVIDGQYYLSIFTVLNDYFSKRDSLPTPDDTKKMFEMLLNAFSQRVKQPRIYTFFRATSRSKEFDQKMYEFLSATDDRLSAFEPRVVELESGPEKASEPVFVDYLSFHLTMGLY